MMHPILVHYTFHESVVHGGAHAEQLLMEIQVLVQMYAGGRTLLSFT